jgi:hypothetical protein
MSRRLLLVSAVLICIAVAAFGQQHLTSPRDLPILIERAQAFWNYASTNQRLKALDLIVPEKKERFLASGGMPFVNARVVGLDFSEDPKKAVLRVSVELLAKDSPSGRLAWTVTDTWIWKDGTWYLDLPDGGAGNPFTSTNGSSAETAQRELESAFKIPISSIEVGTVVQGAPHEVQVPLQYSGSVPARLEIEVPTGFISQKYPQGQVTSSDKSIALALNSDRSEGPFSVPVVLKITRNGASVQHIVTIRGSVFAPLSFTQSPTPFLETPGNQVVITVRNNTEESVEIKYVLGEERFEVLDFTPVIAGHSEGHIRLARTVDTAAKARQITMQLARPVNGRSVYGIPVKMVPVP